MTRTVFAALIVALASPVVPKAAYAGSIPPASATFCGGSLNSSRVAEGLVGTSFGSDDLQSLQKSIVALRRSSGRADVRAGARNASISWSEDSTKVCPSRPAGTVFLPEVAAISGETIAAIAAALRYRRTTPWPTSFPAHVKAPDSSIFVSKRGQYDYVEINDSPAAQRGMPREGCRFSEFYRVDPRTFEVLPYNGCIVGGAALKGVLPAANELPDR